MFKSTIHIQESGLHNCHALVADLAGGKLS
jgi:hypothetical protein